MNSIPLVLGILVIAFLIWIVWRGLDNFGN